MSTEPRPVEDVADELGDALFTYCLSVLCEQDAALAALRETRQLAVRHRRRLRAPARQRAWLYALARYVCLVRLEDASVPPPDRADPAARPRLARLAWPEAAGTTPAQRELLELAGRHGLAADEVAAVLGLPAEETAQLLTQAVCELERTAAALGVLAVDGCPELSQLGRGRGPVLGPALRGELVRHLDDCPTCRGAVERGAAVGPWPGTLRASGSVALVELPPEWWEPGAAFFARDRTAVREPRFDRQGFPQYRRAAGPVAAGPVVAAAVGGDGTEAGGVGGTGGVGGATAAGLRRRGGRSTGRSAGRSAGRPAGRRVTRGQRALLASVVAAAVVAPVLVLAGPWSGAHASRTTAADGPGGIVSAQVSAPSVPAASAVPAVPRASGLPSVDASGGSDGSVGAPAPAGATTSGGGTLSGGVGPVSDVGPPSGPTTSGSGTVVGGGGDGTSGDASGGGTRSMPEPGRLVTTAHTEGGRTVLTLNNPGGQPVSWQATPDAGYLRLSSGSGTLAAGATTTVVVTVDTAAEPSGPWTAHVTLQPSGAVVTFTGTGAPPTSGAPTPTPSDDASPSAAAPTTPPPTTPPPPTDSDTPSPTPSASE